MKFKKHDQLIYSAVGLAALLLVLVAVNFLVSRVPARVDLTEGDLYTLSPGTRKILRGLHSPVKVKLYISQGESVPVPLRGFTQRVEDLVREFKSVAGPNLIVERYNPKPDSEEEDAAQLDGIEPQQIYTGEQFYLGAAVSQLDRKQALSPIAPQRVVRLSPAASSSAPTVAARRSSMVMSYRPGLSPVTTSS